MIKTINARRAAFLLLTWAVIAAFGLPASAQTLECTTRGASPPATGRYPDVVQNGDFRVNGNNSYKDIGDSYNEQTRWTCDFSNQVGNRAFDAFTVRAASLRIVLLTQADGWFDTDSISLAGLPAIADPTIRARKANSRTDVTIDLLDHYQPEQIMARLRETEGMLELFYSDDSTVTFAQLNIELAPAEVKAAARTRAADTWLGKWSAASSYTETDQVWKWWFAVSRTCGKYRIQTHTSGPEKVEILNISPTDLEFLFHDDLGTRISISRTEDNVIAGTVDQPNNTSLPSGRVDGRKTGEADPTGPELAKIDIVDPGTLQPLEEAQMGRTFAVKLTYADTPCEAVTETVTIGIPGGGSQQIDVTGSGRVIVSRPVTVAPAE